MLGIGAREGYPIGFWEFTRKGAVVMALTIAVSAPYLWLRYFVFG
jgi:Na+/H+ antiporter NhaD/arsenite permease-like protein